MTFFNLQNTKGILKNNLITEAGIEFHKTKTNEFGKTQRDSSKCLLLCSTEENSTRKSYILGMRVSKRFIWVLPCLIQAVMTIFFYDFIYFQSFS